MTVVLQLLAAVHIHAHICVFASLSPATSAACSPIRSGDRNAETSVGVGKVRLRYGMKCALLPLGRDSEAAGS